MLTVQQADILSLLADFNCLRESHIKKYIVAKHHSSPEHMTTMLKQLKVMGRIMTADGYVKLPSRKLNTNIIKAFDVMMDLTNGNADLVYPGKNPFMLMFSLETSCSNTQNSLPDEQDTVNILYDHYGVVIAERYCEDNVCRRLYSIDRNLTVIFVLYDKEQQKLIKVENKSYFAIQDDNGKYKFFKAVNEPQHE